MVRGMLSWEDSWEEHSLFDVLQMGDANNVEMQSVNEDVLLRSDGAAAAPSASIQQPPQPSVRLSPKAKHRFPSVHRT